MFIGYLLYCHHQDIQHRDEVYSAYIIADAAIKEGDE